MKEKKVNNYFNKFNKYSYFYNRLLNLALSLSHMFPVVSGNRFQKIYLKNISDDIIY